VVNYSSVIAQESNPLQPFEFLIGGEWSTNTTAQTFEWGVGKKLVHSKLYYITNNDTSLAGEITWFWHPGQKQIKGYGHLLNDQVSFFDYTTEFSDSRRMNNSITGYNSQSMSIPIIESIEFLENDSYRWTMYERVLDELRPGGSIVFNRKN
jgi:hypothetical protein